MWHYKCTVCIIFQYTLNFHFISLLSRHMSCSFAHLKRPAGGSWLWVGHQRELQLLAGLRALIPRHSHLCGQRYMERRGAPVLAWVPCLSININQSVWFNPAGACNSMHAPSSFPRSRNAYSALVLADGTWWSDIEWLIASLLSTYVKRTSIDSVGKNGTCLYSQENKQCFRPLYRNNACIVFLLLFICCRKKVYLWLGQGTGLVSISVSLLFYVMTAHL